MSIRRNTQGYTDLAQIRLFPFHRFTEMAGILAGMGSRLDIDHLENRRVWSRFVASMSIRRNTQGYTDLAQIRLFPLHRFTEMAGILAGMGSRLDIDHLCKIFDKTGPSC